MIKRIQLLSFLAFTLTACHKDWTCTCAYPSSEIVTPYKDMPEKKAEEKCHLSAATDSTSYNCSISKRN